MTADPFDFGGEIAWRPTAEYIGRSRLTAFIDRHALSGCDELLRRSIAEPEWFWPAVLEELDIRFYEPYTKVMIIPVLPFSLTFRDDAGATDIDASTGAM